MVNQDKLAQQPVSNVQWKHRDTLWANDYNPNHVAPPEMALIKTSILEDGWAIPLVIRPDGEIVDGFHRWTLSASPEIYVLTDGYVPVVYLKPSANRAHQMMSTIRYNRARGQHYVLQMANIVAYLRDVEHLAEVEIQTRLGMEAEEVKRLYQHGNMRERAGKAAFGQGWVPTREGTHAGVGRNRRRKP
ncbi:MAG: ParB N-terminal domain-containing protein [Anaerolineae bacterium]|nr:ParB N-terminal domain-containing protein [Anaerolineae bacterium]